MSVKRGELIIPGALPEGTDPLPRFRRRTGFWIFKTGEGFPAEAAKDLNSCPRTLPYRIQNRYGRERKTLRLETAVMENEYIKAVFTPSLGGKLWSMYDKEHGRELLMSNPVVQPGNLAVRDAWMSGGIEWNFGAPGHTYFTCDDVWAAALTDGGGEEFLRIYEFERAKECIWQIDFHLPRNSKQLFSHVRLINPDAEDKTTYWWTNIAVPEDGCTRVLSSSKDVIAICGNTLTYERLPYLSVMPGDLSYSINATRSFDYFFQPEKGVVTSWEAAVNKDGYAFYDRSNAPLIYHKMFCWGNHGGGKHWQQYLSDGVNGEYIEIQAGIARSQMHDRPFPKNSVIEWTQCFGGAFIEPDKIHGVSLDKADEAFSGTIDGLISEETLLYRDAGYRRSADIAVTERDILHRASGWGALENMRREKCAESKLPDTAYFPSDSVSDEQDEWLFLLKTGKMKRTDPDQIPASWMVSDKWMKLLEKRDTWNAHLHYGNMLFEHWDDSSVADKARFWPDAGKFEKLAEEEWLLSDRCEPNIWAKRNLAELCRLRGDKEAAEKYYDLIFSDPASDCDFSFAVEYMEFLNENGKYEKSWELFNKLKPEFQNKDRIMILAASCALRLNELDYVGKLFERDLSAVREGETSLTDLWFEYHARLTAQKTGVIFEENREKLLETAETEHPAPPRIDFRMNVGKNVKYRKTE
ncbi:MAG: DUF5107 domain-containing protein [Clostridia bacterium]|nr:DUF5107 domain-containing protein [Clostridia bacterium]